jgi:hypothetical protein
MLMMVINNSYSNVLAFYYSKERIQSPVPPDFGIDPAWGANLLKDTLKPGQIDTVLQLAEEDIITFSQYLYSLDDGLSISRTLVIEQFDDLKDIYIPIQ